MTSSVPLRRVAAGLTAALALWLPLAVHAAELTVSAAASLTNAFNDLKPMFEAAHPGHKLQFNFAASGALLQQIVKGGAPVDVFVSADEAWMDEEFPLGDGTADTDGVVYCPYCGEPNEVALDPGSGSRQDYIEDCPVCCRPWRVTVRYDADGTAHPGLPWLGCTVLSADADTLRAIRGKAAARPDFFVADMPAAAQQTPWPRRLELPEMLETWVS